jgi:uncharacterized metal-binding protein YceD (DUF177 family)
LSAPVIHDYNLARLGNAGDEIRFEAGADERAAIAALAGALSLARFMVQVTLKKASSSRFALEYRLEAEVTQACVVTLEPVVSRIERTFSRALHFTGGGRAAARGGESSKSREIDLSGQDPEGTDEPEEIESLHVDLAAPALEEFLLALDPYPRCPGVAFDPVEGEVLRPESPFAVLKSLKSSK